MLLCINILARSRKHRGENTDCEYSHLTYDLGSQFTLVACTHDIMLELPSQNYLSGTMFSFLCLFVFMWFHLVLPGGATVTHSGGRKQSVSGEPLLWLYPVIMQLTLAKTNSNHCSLLLASAAQRDVLENRKRNSEL